MKLNAALTRLPTFAAAGDLDPLRAMISIQHGLDAAQEGFEACERGEPAILLRAVLPDRIRLGRAAEGRHMMSAFCHYAPYELAEELGGRRRRSAG